MYYLYFSERIIYWLVFDAFIISGALFYKSFSIIVLLMCMTFIILIPGMVLLIKFLPYVYNKNLSMVPHWRQFVIGGTISLITIFSCLLTLGLVFTKKGSVVHYIEIFWAIFGISSLIIFLIKVTINIPFRQFSLWLFAMILLMNAKFIIHQIINIESSIFITGMIVISVLIWSWLIASVGKEGKIEISNSSNDKLSEYISKKLEITSPISGIRTLITGSITSEKSRVWSVIILFAALTIFGITIIKVLSSYIIQGEELLMIPLITLLILSYQAGESLARLRLLWLKIPGDRHQFWLIWKNNLHTSLKLSILVFSIFGGFVYQIYDVSNVMISFYATILLILLPSMSYFTAWIRLKGQSKSIFVIFSGIVTYMTLIYLIILTLAIDEYIPVLRLAVFSSLVGLICYFRVKKGFLTLDWLDIRPKNKNQDIFSVELNNQASSNLFRGF